MMRTHHERPSQRSRSSSGMKAVSNFSRRAGGARKSKRVRGIRFGSDSNSSRVEMTKQTGSNKSDMLGAIMQLMVTGSFRYYSDDFSVDRFISRRWDRPRSFSTISCVEGIFVCLIMCGMLIPISRNRKKISPADGEIVSCFREVRGNSYTARRWRMIRPVWI